MDRRKSLKALVVGTVSTGVLIEACKTDKREGPDSPKEVQAEQPGINRMAEEKANEDAIKAMPKFFTDAEMATITVLADIIIPKDSVSGSASDAKVPEFIEFIVKDIPDHQTPIRGGLKWLDIHCFNRYEKPFTEATTSEQIAIIDEIAYPKKSKPEMQAGVAFFNRMRSLTMSGFYTTEIGIKDIGYVGNVPNQWPGIPEDVLKQYGMENVKI